MNRPSSQLRQPRLAEVVAEVLRSRILSGAVRDGDSIGRQEDLLNEFTVSKPSLREALRILETEGLVTVQRGSIGGAIVHAPNVASAAYMLSLVLESRGVTLDDVGTALKQLEPVCAALCASRDDRAATVVPKLRAIQAETENSIDDLYALTMNARQFHEELVSGCGNETVILLVGALESLWTAHQQRWIERVVEEGTAPKQERRSMALETHREMLELVEQGRPDDVAKLAHEHLSSSILYQESDVERQPVRSSLVRKAQ